MRSDKEIQDELKKLNDLKGQLPETGSSGEGVAGGLEKQIDVLTRKMTPDDIFELGTEQNWSQFEIQKADEAAQWLAGDKDQLADDPAGWKSMLSQAGGQRSSDNPDQGQQPLQAS